MRASPSRLSVSITEIQNQLKNEKQISSGLKKQLKEVLSRNQNLESLVIDLQEMMQTKTPDESLLETSQIRSQLENSTKQIELYKSKLENKREQIEKYQHQLLKS